MEKLTYKNMVKIAEAVSDIFNAKPMISYSDGNLRVTAKFLNGKVITSELPIADKLSLEYDIVYTVTRILEGYMNDVFSI